MCLKWALEHAASLESWAKIFAIAFGGAWALYRFGLLRKGETALDITLSCETLETANAQHLVTFDVALANKGGVKIAARNTLVPDRQDTTLAVAYQDSYERLLYPIDLLLRRIDGPTNSDGSIRWFPGADTKSPSNTDLELDLLSDYELDGTYAFWMEPRETYHLGASCLMTAGDYLVMVTFVGKQAAEDWWRRTFVVRVPQPARPISAR